MQAIQKLTFIILILFLATAFIHAQTSQLINYQGKLTGKDGQALTGIYKMTFRIYPNKTDDIDLWRETQDSVTVNNGVFNVILGKKTTFPTDLFAKTGDRYLGITLPGDLEMKPRFKLNCVPYALHANSAKSLCAADGDPMNAVVVDANGSVGIGTNNPSSKLHIHSSGVTDYPNNALIVSTLYGYASFGALNSSYFHMYTDRGKFYFDNPCHANGGFHTYSSRSKKQDIQYLNTTDERKILQSLLAMRMVYFRYLDERINQKIHLGVIAEESPKQILSESNDSISLMDFSAYAITAIKAQQRIIDDLLKRIENLENNISKPRE